MILRLFMLTIFLLLSAPCTAPAQTQASLLPHFDHVVVVIEENKSFQDIIGNGEAPYINRLAKEGALMEQSYAVTHPSLPNYLALFSGSTHGVRDDSCRHALQGATLAGQLTKVNAGFAIFSQTMPSTGFTGCYHHAYRKKHNPVAYFAALSAGINRPFKDFPQNFSKLPAVSFVIPNLKKDMHDGTIAQGDAWLRKHMGAYIRWAKAHNSLLILTWDEDDNTKHNRIPTVFVGAHVLPGRYTQHINHYNVLATLTDIYQAAPPGRAATAKPISGIWTK